MSKKKKKRESPLMKVMYEISEELEDIIGVEVAARPTVVKKLWAYIKKKKLQGESDKRIITPDKKMAKVFGKKSFNMMQLAKGIGKHLTKIDE